MKKAISIGCGCGERREIEEEGKDKGVRRKWKGEEYNQKGKRGYLRLPVNQTIKQDKDGENLSCELVTVIMGAKKTKQKQKCHPVKYCHRKN